MLIRTSAMTPHFGLYALPEAMETLSQVGDLAALAKDAVTGATPPPGSHPLPRVFALP